VYDVIRAKLYQRLFANPPFLGQASARRASLALVTKTPIK